MSICTTGLSAVLEGAIWKNNFNFVLFPHGPTGCSKVHLVQDLYSGITVLLLERVEPVLSSGRSCFSPCSWIGGIISAHRALLCV